MVAEASPLVTVSLVDAQVETELATRYGVRSVPLTLVDRELGITGAYTPAELVDRLLGRDDAAYARDVLISLAEQGRFGDAASRISTPDGGAAFVQAWKGSATSLRIALMMAVEEALEEERASLDPLVGSLLPVLEAEDAALRGDTADLLGKIGHGDAREALEALLEDPNEDVAEIAGEAIEEIDERA